ncbi:MAG: sensor histidine kinase, partial [Flavobacterium sp.]
LTSTYAALENFSKSKHYLEIHKNLKNENLDNKIIKFTYYFNFANFNVEKDILSSEQALNELKGISLKSQNDYFKGLYFKTESHLKFAKKDYTKSLVAVDSALFYFNKTKSEFYTLNTYTLKIKILKKMNFFKEAFDVLDEHDKLKQKIDELQVDAYIQEAELRYNDINQKLTLTKLKLKTEKQEKLKENFIYIFVIFTFIIIFAAFLLFQNNKEINFQKKIINSKIQTNTFLTILKTEDRERKRISNELHDIVGAKMSVLKLMIENVFSENYNHKDQYKRTTAFIDKIIEEIRQISHNLLPRNIKCVGLDKSISELVDNINNQTKVHIDYFSSGIDDKIDEYYSLFIYRIVQEFIGNIIKHSKATECILNIYKNKNQIHITIEDNGIGFEINKKHLEQFCK